MHRLAAECSFGVIQLSFNLMQVRYSCALHSVYFVCLVENATTPRRAETVRCAGVHCCRAILGSFLLWETDNGCSCHQRVLCGWRWSPSFTGRVTKRVCVIWLSLVSMSRTRMPLDWMLSPCAWQYSSATTKPAACACTVEEVASHLSRAKVLRSHRVISQKPKTSAEFQRATGSRQCSSVCVFVWTCYQWFIFCFDMINTTVDETDCCFTSQPSEWTNVSQLNGG